MPAAYAYPVSVSPLPRPRASPGLAASPGASPELAASPGASPELAAAVLYPMLPVHIPVLCVFLSFLGAARRFGLLVFW